MDVITLALAKKMVASSTPDLTQYAKLTDLDPLASQDWVENKDYATETYVDNQISSLIGGAPEALDTLKELADAVNGVATQTWVEEKGYLTEHQDISGKLNILPNVEDESDPGYGYPYWIPYNFEFTPEAENVKLTLHTLTLDNNFLKMDFNKDIPTATSAVSGFMSAADKVKLNSALTEHQDISGKQDKIIAGDNISIADDGKTISAINTKYTITVDI